MTLPKDCRDWIDSQDSEFMQPVATYFDDGEAQVYVAPQYEIDCADEFTAGWYARLSAPGYMDCTDWLGPFDSEELALVALWESFGDY